MTAVGGNTQGTGVIATNNAASVLAAVIGTCGTVSASTQVILNDGGTPEIRDSTHSREVVLQKDNQ